MAHPFLGNSFWSQSFYVYRIKKFHTLDWCCKIVLQGRELLWPPTGEQHISSRPVHLSYCADHIYTTVFFGPIIDPWYQKRGSARDKAWDTTVGGVPTHELFAVRNEFFDRAQTVVDPIAALLLDTLMGIEIILQQNKRKCTNPRQASYLATRRRCCKANCRVTRFVRVRLRARSRELHPSPLTGRRVILRKLLAHVKLTLDFLRGTSSSLQKN